MIEYGEYRVTLRPTGLSEYALHDYSQRVLVENALTSFEAEHIARNLYPGWSVVRVEGVKFNS